MDPFNLLTLPCTKNKNKIKRKTGLYEWYKFPPTKMWKILKSISNVILPVELATVGICRCFLLCSCNYSHTAYMDCILSFYLKCFNHVFFCLVVEPLSMKAGLLGLWEWRTRWSEQAYRWPESWGWIPGWAQQGPPRSSNNHWPRSSECLENKAEIILRDLWEA